MKNKFYLKSIGTLILSLSIMSFGLAPEKPNGPAFSLTNSKSTLKWKGEKPGGEHYGVVEVLNGKIDTDGSTVSGGSFEINLNSIVCHDLENENFNKKLVDHLKSDDFFYTEKYPTAYFNITGVKVHKKNVDGFQASHMVTGDLTIRGITKEITFPANIKIMNDKVHASSPDIVLDRTAWNVNHMSKSVFADLKDRYVNDEMIVALDLHFDVN